MAYKVLDAFSIGKNTAVTIEGNGMDLKNGISIFTPEGKKFDLLSVAMVAGKVEEGVNKSTTILVKGDFTANEFTI